jgi:creatinine amidohydrolase
VFEGDPKASRVFLAEALKPKATGKHTSTREMTSTGGWSVRDTHKASVERGQEESDGFVEGAVKFIQKWNELKPLKPLTERRQY